ncbi:hypothetical protein ACHHYP_05391 [Achlya hypogyna]|uniref:EF-hand domain-containing protein n=1 Tax=Achlya hypogyna TaxID=1202772 RepID=A0A1V9YY06_ACHHY|nr:hypothetical protein ACHHYP_05391 [Achlya hypogyna]
MPVAVRGRRDTREQGLPRKPPVPKFSRRALRVTVAHDDNLRPPSLALHEPSPTHHDMTERSFRQLQTKCFQLKPPLSPSIRSFDPPQSPSKLLSIRSSAASSEYEPSDNDSNAGTFLWTQQQHDIRLLQAPLSPAESHMVKAAPTFGCRECGSKDLTAFCWKGCRNFTSLEELNALQRSLLERNQRLETLVCTQEAALATVTATKDEQAQIVALVQQELRRIHTGAMTACEGPDAANAAIRPAWMTTAVRALVHRFDLDGDGLLCLGEMNALKSQLQHTALYSADAFRDLIARYCLDARPCSAADDNNRVALGLTPEGLLQLYDAVGPDSLEHDLAHLHIYVGRSKAPDDPAVELVGMLTALDSHLQAAMASKARLREEHDDKARTIARLKESLVAATAQVVETREAWSVAQNSSHRLQDELQSLQAKHNAYVHNNVVSKAEMVSGQDAVVEMRALLEAQIAETELWQRQCWELQEQLTAISESCTSHKQNLWRVKDAKKAEERRSMLLYMQANQGKRHDISHR